MFFLLTLPFRIVFGLFFGLSLVCAGRGAFLYLRALAAQRAEARVKVPIAAEA